jgi:ABC-type transport system involved in multi-copper enzyme maturation permease subunit
MIVAISVLGIFTNLLLFPSQEFKESGWIKLFYRTFYLLLFPLIILLFFAIGIRIEEYGLTVNRYIITLLGIWLSFIAIYFSFGKKDIKVIPISLASFMIFASFGPWGMFSLSELNQTNRLIRVLEKNELLVNGKIQNETQWEISEKGAIKSLENGEKINLDQESLKEVNSIIQYLGDYHGLKDLEAWFDQDLKSIMQTSASNSKSNSPAMDWDELFIKSMGLDYIPAYELEYDQPETKQLNFVATGEFRYPIEGFDQLIKFDASRYAQMKSGENDLILSLDKEGESVLLISSNGRENRVNLKQFIQDLQLLYTNTYNTVEWEDLRFEYNSGDLNLVMFFENIDARSQDGELIIESLNGFAMIGKQDLTNEKP